MVTTKGTILRMSTFRVDYLRWFSLAGILLTFAAIILLVPPEKTLGETIRLIYVHVAFTRAGMYGFYIAGLLGAIVIVLGNPRLQALTQTVTWVSFFLFFVGGIFSIFAQRASWGGLPFSEPRNRTSLQVMAVVIIVLIGNSWIPWIRLRGVLYLLLAGYVAWVIPRTPLVLHPANAASSSSSPWFRVTFPVLTALVLLLGLWIVWYFERPRNNE